MNRRPCEVLLIDGDTLVYRYGLMDHTPVDFEDAPPVNPLEAAKLAIGQKLQYLLDDTGVPTFRIALAAPGRCFRYGFYPQYKAHRQPSPDIINQLRQWFRVEYSEFLLEWPHTIPVETDDILAYHHQVDGTTCIVSNDKDFYTLPGWNYHPFTGDLRWISGESAYLTFWYQVLVGDSADGFPGCKGIGKVKAEEILLTAWGEHALLSEVVAFTYLSQGCTLDDLVINRCLANIGIPQVPSNLRGMKLLPDRYLKVLEMIT
jgi:DNA polymerase-1